MKYQRKAFFNPARFFHTAALAAFALGHSAASPAQEPPDEELEEIVVTGSHIARSGLVTPTPIMTLDAGAIAASGLSNMGDLLLELPSVNIGITPTGSQSGTDQGGLFSINLRDLGSDRTLTLIDGKRVVSNRPGANLVSANTIPDDMVERVEVITGGASAVYGSDALAGVVNFILKDDFEGATFRVRGGNSQDGGGDKYTASATLGGNFDNDRGNVIFNLSFDKATEIRGNERDYSLIDRRQRRVRTASGAPGGRENVFVNVVEDVLSSTSRTARIDVQGLSSSEGRFRVIPGTGETVLGFSTSDHGYNSQDFQSQFGPYERILAGTKLNYNLTDNHKLFAQAFFVSDETDSFTNPEGIDSEDANPGRLVHRQGLTLDYPFLPDNVRQAATERLFGDPLDPLDNGVAASLGCDDGAGGIDVACANSEIGIIEWRRRFFSQGRRTKPNTRETLRLAMGFEGQIWDDWGYNLSANFGRATQSQVQTPDFVRPNFSASLELEPDPDNPGQFRCADGNARDRGCVPVNIFAGEDLSPEQIRWLTSRALFQATAEQTVIAGNVTGDLWELPAGPLGVAAGFEYREEIAQTRTDTLSEQRGITTSALPSSDGTFDVSEVFVEAVVPLLSDQPFAEALNLEFAVRYADYSHVGDVVSYKAGGDWAPVDAIRFRGMYSRAQRAPNIREAFSAPRETGFSIQIDPCEGITGQDLLDGGNLAASCDRESAVFRQLLIDPVTGLPRVDPNDPAQLLEFAFDDETVRRGFNLSNPLLEEETADTYTAGVVFTPDNLIPGLGLTIDYYRIEIEGAIVPSARQEALDLCHQSGLSTRNPDCDLIQRNGLGQVFRIDTLERNQDTLEVEGVDVFLQYDFSLDSLLPGDFTLTTNYSHKITNTITRIDPLTGDLLVTDNKGEVDDIEDRVRLSLGYRKENFGVNWRVLYYGETVGENDVVDTQRDVLARIASGDLIAPAGEELMTVDQLKIKAQWYHNLNFSYDWDAGVKYDVQFFAGINNVFDNEPPLIHSRLYSSQARSRCGSECSIYENIGRFWYVGVKLDL